MGVFRGFWRWFIAYRKADKRKPALTKAPISYNSYNSYHSYPRALPHRARLAVPHLHIMEKRE